MEVPQHFLVFHVNFLTVHKGITNEFFAIQIAIMQFHTGNLAVFISGVIIDSFCGITAAGIYGLFVKVSYFYATLLLGDGA